MPAKPIDIIVAYERNRGIGKDGEIPWRLQADIRRFAQLTITTVDPKLQNAVIMGRKTWDSIPAKYRPLSRRMNVVLTLSERTFYGATTAHSFHSALRYIEYSSKIERIFVIGGAEIYACAMPHAENIYATEVDINVDCDVFFTALYKEFKLVEESPREEDKGVSFVYKHFKRENVT